MTMHRNSLASHAVLHACEKTLAILRVYRTSLVPLTDREAAGIRGVHVAELRPRITDAIHDGLLAEVVDVWDDKTRRNVRTVTITAAGREVLAQGGGL